MTISEANAVNVLVRAIFEIDLIGYDDLPPAPAEVRASAALLATKANKALSAGVSGEMVDRAMFRLHLESDDL